MADAEQVPFRCALEHRARPPWTRCAVQCASCRLWWPTQPAQIADKSSPTRCLPPESP